MVQINTLLIANRGEITRRIMRTAQRMGIRCIAVYSDADQAALHVQMADHAVCIGGAQPAQSYLNIPNVIQAAIATGADAIHPGYGFLAENAGFAQAVVDAGLVFVGPDAASIELMGNKRQAKRKMQTANVPCIPGYDEADQSDDTLIQAASGIGYPLMVKAAAGGGGRGMRLVQNADEVANAIQSARSEAESAFGSGELILERALLNARHVEVQVFGDSHGQVIHLGERDCSVQRRHQKLIEESPSPAVDAELRAAMGQAAVQAAKTIYYCGAGTVEFLLAGRDFYFMEMNTRLQVEHPVTEMITGFDLVEWQLRIARGEALPTTNVTLQGHAIEARLCTEDASQDFLPQAGDILHWETAATARTDTGIQSGGVISPYYDSMQAKIIVHAADRPVAIAKLKQALQQTVLLGVTSNRDALLQMLALPAFHSGDYHTSILQDFAASVADELTSVAACARYLAAQQALQAAVPAELLGWHSSPVSDTGGATAIVKLQLPNDKQVQINVASNGTGLHTPELGNISYTKIAANRWQLQTETTQYDVCYAEATDNTNEFWISCAQGVLVATDVTLPDANAAEAGGDAVIKAPMDGRIIAVSAKPGDTVQKGDVLVVLEAMKMQFQLTAGRDGEVAEVAVAVDEQVKNRAILLRLSD